VAKFFVPSDQGPVDLDDGSIVASGDTVDLTKTRQDHPHNADLIANGRLVGATAAAERAAEEIKEEVS
jgi:urocanate hydratase